MSDYSDIQAELDDFKNAVYGEEVRDSMISAIKKIHDLAESAAGAPDATSASAGQAPIADGAGGWAWGDVATSGDSVPTEVRQAILALFQNGVYTRDDMSDEVAVIQSWATEITAISVSPTTLRINGMSQETIVATTQPSGGIVTWSSSDESIATVSGGVVTPTGVNGSCTITASCGGKSATCAVTISGFATLTGISAVYTQSGTVYDTDTLDSLRSDLVVTASYDDSTTRTITDYTLQGTLTEGTSTITVSYGGKTATFAVSVTEYVFIGIVASGSPSVADGILTVSDSGYFITNQVFNPASQPWEIQTKLKATSTTGEYRDVVTSYTLNGSPAREVLLQSYGAYLNVFLASTDDNWNIGTIQQSGTLYPNTWVWIKVGYDGTQYYMEKSTDGVTYNMVGTLESATTITGAYALAFGAIRNASYFNGQIDMNETKIYINNALWAEYSA